ncbi:uncharacterized protein TNCV_1131461 [Trichonephila clavipes]|nr:uncharacterized protein TNCV_1131461 [Trichonephila clavipes]
MLEKVPTSKDVGLTPPAEGMSNISKYPGHLPDFTCYKSNPRNQGLVGDDRACIRETTKSTLYKKILPQPLNLLKLYVTQLTFKRFKETNNTNSLSPTLSVKTILAVENSKRKRKRVQSKNGEVLTNENVLERFAAEESDRKNKFHQVNIKKDVNDTDSFKVRQGSWVEMLSNGQ